MQTSTPFISRPRLGFVDKLGLYINQHLVFGKRVQDDRVAVKDADVGNVRGAFPRDANSSIGTTAYVADAWVIEEGSVGHRSSSRADLRRDTLKGLGGITARAREKIGGTYRDGIRSSRHAMHVAISRATAHNPRQSPPRDLSRLRERGVHDTGPAHVSGYLK